MTFVFKTEVFSLAVASAGALLSIGMLLYVTSYIFRNSEMDDAVGDARVWVVRVTFFAQPLTDHEHYHSTMNRRSDVKQSHASERLPLNCSRAASDAPTFRSTARSYSMSRSTLFAWGWIAGYSALNAASTSAFGSSIMNNNASRKSANLAIPASRTTDLAP